MDIYPYKYCKIQVARDNFCYYEIHPLLWVFLRTALIDWKL